MYLRGVIVSVSTSYQSLISSGQLSSQSVGSLRLYGPGPGTDTGAGTGPGAVNGEQEKKKKTVTPFVRSRFDVSRYMR